MVKGKFVIRTLATYRGRCMAKGCENFGTRAIINNAQRLWDCSEYCHNKILRDGPRQYVCDAKDCDRKATEVLAETGSSLGWLCCGGKLCRDHIKQGDTKPLPY